MLSSGLERDVLSWSTVKRFPLALVGVSILASVTHGRATAQEASDTQRPAVFVQLDKSSSDELPEHKRRELSDSVRDIADQIEKRPGIRLARSRGDASVVVRVLDRRIEMGTTSQVDYGGSYTQKHYQSRYVLAFRVDAGGRGYESETALAGAFVTWKRVAGTVAKDVEIWVQSLRSETFGAERP